MFILLLLLNNELVEYRGFIIMDEKNKISTGIDELFDIKNQQKLLETELNQLYHDFVSDFNETFDTGYKSKLTQIKKDKFDRLLYAADVVEYLLKEGYTDKSNTIKSTDLIEKEMPHSTVYRKDIDYIFDQRFKFTPRATELFVQLNKNDYFLNDVEKAQKYVDIIRKYF